MPDQTYASLPTAPLQSTTPAGLNIAEPDQVTGYPTDATKVKSKEVVTELGGTGTTIVNGFLANQDYNPEFTGTKRIDLFNEMRTDATVRAGLSAVKLPLLSADWYIKEPNGEDELGDVADFVNRQAWALSNYAHNMMRIFHMTKNHPAIMGYVFGNETNLYKGGYQNLGGVLTIDDWWNFANTVAAEMKHHDSNHILGICSGMGDPTGSQSVIDAENAGKLNNFDFHGVNTYCTDSWKIPSDNTKTFWNNVWNPTNYKPVIITETGIDSYNNNTGQQDEATQSTYVQALWNTRDTSKCAGICFFGFCDELWKTINDYPSGTLPTNDYNYTNVGFPATSDGFWMPDGFGNEQHFGWVTYMKPTPYADPPHIKQVAFTMKNTW